MNKKYSTISSVDKAKLIHTWLEEHKARNITALNIKTAVTDIVIIASASSSRHAKSLADNINLHAKKENFELLSIEGHQSGTWVLVDLNDVVVHIFLEDNREQYQLESLWHEAESLILDSRVKKD